MTGKRRRSRGAGEGTIRQRSDGRWEAMLTIGHDPATGKQTRRSVYGKTRAEAAKKLAELQVQHHRGEAVRQGDISLLSYLRAFARTRRPYVRPSTAINHDQYLTLVAAQPQSAVPVAQFRSRHAEELYAALTCDYSDSVVRHVRIFVNQALRDAIKNDILRSPSALEAGVPRREQEPVARALTPDEAARLLEALANNRVQMLVRFLLATGLRIGEALALTWADYTPDTGALRVERSLSTTGGQRRAVGPTKTRAGRRTLYIPPALAEHLTAWREVTRAEALLPGYESNELIFPNMYGRPAQYNLIRREFTAGARRAGLEGLRLHDLRHTFATRLILKGNDPRTVSALLGHTDARVTLAIYTHAQTETSKAAMMSLEE